VCVPASPGVFEPTWRRPFSVRVSCLSLVSILVMFCHLTGTSGGPNSLGDCRVEVGHVSGKQENLDSVSSRVQRSISNATTNARNFHHSLVRVDEHRQRSSEASIDLGQATHGHITADQICLCHTRTKLRRGAVTGGVASSAPMHAGTRVRLICALAHALLMRLSVYWRVGRVMSIRVGVLFRRSTKASECLLRSAAEIAL